MADGKETQAGHRKGKGEKELKEQGDRVLVALYDCLWNVAHEDYIN